jgi:hypothetical protein
MAVDQVTNLPNRGPCVGWSVSSQSAMLALAAKLGDLALRSDNTTTYILTTNDPTSITAWKALPSSGGGGGGGGITTVGTIDSETPSSDGLVISGSTITTQSASATAPGLVSTGAQTFAGVKTLTSPIFVTPALGTPASGVATNLTGLPLTSGVTGTLPVANGGTGITSLGTGVATFLETPNSANLAAAVTNETGSGALVFATSPTLVTPVLGTPSSGTLTSCTGLPLSTGVTGTLPVANGGTGITSGTSGGVLAYTASGTLASSGALTANQVVIGGGAGFAPSTLAAGSAFQTLAANASGTPTWVDGFAASYKTEWFEDFTGGAATGSAYLNLSGNTGTGAVASFTFSQDVGHMGVVRFSTGTTTTGGAYHGADVFAIFGASGGTHDLEWLVYLPAASDGTDTYQLWMGFGNQTNYTQPSNGVYFGYTHGTNSGNWTLNATKGSSTTTTNASSGPTFSGWNKFRINIDSTASTATFYHNGSSLGTVTTNIPVTVSTHKTGIQLSILKSAGTNDRICYLDYVGYRCVYNTAR